MANQVYANRREVACKAADGKSTSAFPDVCFLPPDKTPASPLGIPTPLPNTAFASDTTDGSKNVKISGKEIMLKQESYFKKSTGNEASKATQKKGFVTSTEEGKAYFNSWSMDVKFEGENVVRHLDLTTHNHGSFPGNSPPWAYQDAQAMVSTKACEEEVANKRNKCEEKGLSTTEAQCNDPECNAARKCLLVTYNQGKRKGKASSVGCCEGEQPHHLVEAHCFYEVGMRGVAGQRTVKAPRGKRAYDDNSAPCVCAKGPRHAMEHGQYHAFQQKIEAVHHNKNGKWSYADARNAGVKAHHAVNPDCREGCTEAQIDAYHKERCGMQDSTELRTDPQAATRSAGELDAKQTEALQNELSRLTGGEHASTSI